MLGERELERDRRLSGVKFEKLSENLFKVVRSHISLG